MIHKLVLIHTVFLSPIHQTFIGRLYLPNMVLGTGYKAKEDALEVLKA